MKNRRSKWKLTDNRGKWKFPLTDVDNVRSILIRPDMISQEIYVYNGKSFKPVKIKLQHLGYKIGDLVHSKIIYKRHYGKKIRN